jgi:hypothetical protein
VAEPSESIYNCRVLISRSPIQSIRYSIFIGVLAGSVFSGSGAFAVEPIPISTQAELEAIGSSDGARAGDYFLNFAGSELVLTNPGNSTYISGTFTGTFSGNGKTLSGLTKPLFDVIGTYLNSAEVSDLNLVTASGSGAQGRGVLSNDLFNSAIDNVTANGTLSSNSNADIGGLVGLSIQGNFRESSADVNISSAGENIGGLVGRIQDSQIHESRGLGDVHGGRNVGGLVGQSIDSSIERSQAKGLVSGREAITSYETVNFCQSGTCNWINLPIFALQENIGGLIGESAGSTIFDSTSQSAISGRKNIGGLIGKSSLDTLTNASSSGNVSGVTIRLSEQKGFNPITGNDFLYFLQAEPEKIGGLIGSSSSTISNSRASGNVSTNNGTDIGGLVGNSSGSVETTFSTSSVNGSVNIGGLVGNSSGTISKSFATGAVSGISSVGGLVGNASGEIKNTYASGSVDGGTFTGGLVGNLEGLVSNSYSISSINSNIGAGANRIGGLVGVQTSGSISNSYATGGGVGVVGSPDFVGGLVGWLSSGSIENSFSYINGDVGGDFLFYLNGENDGLTQIAYGGLVGYRSYGSTIANSYGYVSGRSYPNSNLVLTAGLFSSSASSTCAFQANAEGIFDLTHGSPDDCLLGPNSLQSFPSVVTVVNSLSAGNTLAAYGTNSCFDSGNPYLLALANIYEVCNGGSTAPTGRSQRARVDREAREALQVRTLERIQKSLGFNQETLMPASAAISFLGPREEIDIDKVKSVEIEPTVNVKVSTKAGEALQISLKSDSKEPVELWVKSPDGTWLLAGVITFDKDGNAILPPLQFKNVGEFTLVLSKPTLDSAKGSAPANQTGSLLVEVI